ncbi:MAG: hypothetical protein LH649_08850, partial [Pseudanabaena sp. CAN_BIN31]|nr:hypothetical protein [Pseudanabaena sp. CAN_BIN31]
LFFFRHLYIFCCMVFLKKPLNFMARRRAAFYFRVFNTGGDRYKSKRYFISFTFYLKIIINIKKKIIFNLFRQKFSTAFSTDIKAFSTDKY